MPLLRRNAPKLLSTVRGKQHATQDDHEDTLPTPPPSNRSRTSGLNAANAEAEVEDVNRDPESSDDETSGLAQLDRPAVFKTVESRFHVAHTVLRVPMFKTPATISSASLSSKRSNDSDGGSSDVEDAIFSSQGSKKQRTSYGGNIHALPVKTRPKQFMYGKAAKASSPKRKSGAKFKKPNEEKRKDAAPTPQFKVAKGADLFQFKGNDVEPHFKPPRASGHTANSRSPSLSSLSSAPSSPGVEEIQGLDLPDAQPYTPTVDCTICGHSVDKFVREDFEDRYKPGKRMSYKWQQRFCRYHKRAAATQAWKERGYPEIDCSTLEARMLKLQSHLEGVISGKKSSFYRDELAERLKERTKTTLQALQSKDAKGSATVGYYGPRGEKVMTDHIIAHLSDRLREQAAKDDLVAEAGISGGVSGFIQSVLVSELASKLVQEDLNVSEARAQEVVSESAELGDLLNPEIEEGVDRSELMDVDGDGDE